jgi:hypothetical protein
MENRIASVRSGTFFFEQKSEAEVGVWEATNFFLDPLLSVSGPAQHRRGMVADRIVERKHGRLPVSVTGVASAALWTASPVLRHRVVAVAHVAAAELLNWLVNV